MELPAASKFGQKLAHTDKHIRDKAVKSLTLYLVKKKEWSDLDLDKIWKALFYCMWMSDKPKIQNELAENLSKLMHAFPSKILSMRFLHSFFKTIHREWHGIDGLRLDKFYSLIRKMLYQSFQFLQNSPDQAEDFSTHISTEILSKLPNGLRLHLCDVYIQELHKSIGATVPSDNLVMLLEPFFTLISSETDKIVTKRVNDMVFEAMLKEYQFQDTLKEEATTDSEDAESEENEPKIFGAANLAEIQHRIFDLAAAAETQDRNRNILYSIYSAYYGATKVDSAKKDRKRAATNSSSENDQVSKKKRRKQNKASSSIDVVDEIESSPKKLTKESESPVKEMKSLKKADEAANDKKALKVKEVTKESPKKAESPQKKSLEVKKDAEVVTKSNDKKSKKELKKVATETAKVTEATKVTGKKTKEAPEGKKVVAKEAPAKVESEKKKQKAPASQKEKATPFPRCTSCGGFGKGLIPVNKSMCGYCERNAKKAAKAQAAADKKRKASAVVAEDESTSESSKKVRFGTNKALPYELSMKRMKKSVEKDLVKPATGKGVLKVKEVIATATSNVKKNTSLNVKRARAADFF